MRFKFFQAENNFSTTALRQDVVALLPTQSRPIPKQVSNLTWTLTWYPSMDHTPPSPPTSHFLFRVTHCVCFKQTLPPLLVPPTQRVGHFKYTPLLLVPPTLMMLAWGKPEASIYKCHDSRQIPIPNMKESIGSAARWPLALLKRAAPSLNIEWKPRDCGGAGLTWD